MPLIIGLNGDAGVGKDEFARFAEEWTSEFPQSTCRLFSFAKPIYDLASVIFGTTPAELGERSQKEVPIWRTVTQRSLEAAAQMWEDYRLSDFADFSYVWPIFEEMYFGARRTGPITSAEEDALYSIYISAREILQLLGTELGRNLVHPDVWLITCQRCIAEVGASLSIVSDVRFDNEAIFIHQIPGMDEAIVLKIVSPKSPFKIKSGHASESGIREDLINDYFNNTFEGLDKLREDVFTYLEKNAFLCI